MYGAIVLLPKYSSDTIAFIYFVNPCSCTGSGLSPITLSISQCPFQSTLPHGERHPIAPAVDAQYLFQSTLPNGERLYYPAFWVRRESISIHAPARGATQYVFFLPHSFLDFNPRSRTGSDVVRYIQIKRSHYFNPRSRTGSDPLYRSCFWGGGYFNPRSRTGSDGYTFA